MSFAETLNSVLGAVGLASSPDADNDAQAAASTAPDAAAGLILGDVFRVEEFAPTTGSLSAWSGRVFYVESLVPGRVVLVQMPEITETVFATASLPLALEQLGIRRVTVLQRPPVGERGYTRQHRLQIGATVRVFFAGPAGHSREAEERIGLAPLRGVVRALDDVRDRVTIEMFGQSQGDATGNRTVDVEFAHLGIPPRSNIARIECERAPGDDDNSSGSGANDGLELAAELAAQKSGVEDNHEMFGTRADVEHLANTTEKDEPSGDVLLDVEMDTQRDDFYAVELPPLPLSCGLELFWSTKTQFDRYAALREEFSEIYSCESAFRGRVIGPRSASDECGLVRAFLGLSPQLPPPTWAVPIVPRRREVCCGRDEVSSLVSASVVCGRARSVSVL